MLLSMAHRISATLLGMLAALALGLGLAACGDSGGSSVASTDAASTSAAPNFSTHNNDRDNDGDHNNDDEKVLYFGHAADAADQHYLVALVTRYFAAAAGERGAAVCHMLVPFIAEAVAEQDGRSPGLYGKTCAVVLSKLYKQHHSLQVQKHATLRIIGVRVEGDRALAILDFPSIPEVRQIAERRVAGAWKLLDLQDGIIE